MAESLSSHPPLQIGIRAIDNKKSLDYLNLELSTNYRKVKTVDNNILGCNLDSSHKLHSLFSEDPSQNLIIDLIINLSRNLDLENKRNFKSIESVLDLLKTKNLELKNIKESLDFIKNQNSVILEKISKVDFSQITKILDFNKSREIELDIKKNFIKIEESFKELKGLILS